MSCEGPFLLKALFYVSTKGQLVESVKLAITAILCPEPPTRKITMNARG